MHYTMLKNSVILLTSLHIPIPKNAIQIDKQGIIISPAATGARSALKLSRARDRSNDKRVYNIKIKKGSIVIKLLTHSYKEYYYHQD